MNEVIERAVGILSPLCGEHCKIGLILGSGLGEYAEKIENKRFVNYSELPGFRSPAWKGTPGGSSLANSLVKPSSACRAGFITTRDIRSHRLQFPSA